MSGENWHYYLGKLAPFVFKIATPHGHGTGWQIFKNSKSLCGIATAYHVIKHAHEWDEPIKLIVPEKNQSKILKDEDRVIFPYPEKDLAFILFKNTDLTLPDGNTKLIPTKKTLKAGVSVGWCGFPAVMPEELCFFAGHVSTFLNKDDSYLVDGVAINGVSGGPAFFTEGDQSKEVKICGVLTAYIPNRNTGETLPGLSVVASVEPYREMLEKLQSLDEAEEKAQTINSDSPNKL